MKLGGETRSPELSHSGISHYDFGIGCDRPLYKKQIGGGGGGSRPKMKLGAKTRPPGL